MLSSISISSRCRTLRTVSMSPWRKKRGDNVQRQGVALCYGAAHDLGAACRTIDQVRFRQRAWRGHGRRGNLRVGVEGQQRQAIKRGVAVGREQPGDGQAVRRGRFGNQLTKQFFKHPLLLAGMRRGRDIEFARGKQQMFLALVLRIEREIHDAIQRLVGR